MKQIALLIFAVLAFSTANFAAAASKSTQFCASENQSAVALQNQNFAQLSVADYEKMSGKKLNFFQKAKFKFAQKQLKKATKKYGNGEAKGGEISQGLYIVLAIFGLAWIAMGVMDDWGGSQWIINLLLTLLFWLPGLIHALVVMGDYYD